MNKLSIGKQIIIDTSGDYLLEESEELEEIIIKENIQVKLFFLSRQKSKELKIKVEEDSCFFCQVFLNNSALDVNVELMGKITLVISGICLKNEYIHTFINHLKDNTVSEVYNHLVNYGDSTVEIRVDAIVENGIKNTTLHQDNKIILLGSGSGQIKPNLYTHDFECYASHSAYVSRFKKEELFYLMSRGISKTDSENLLVKSFLLGKFDVDTYNLHLLENIINVRR